MTESDHFRAPESRSGEEARPEGWKDLRPRLVVGLGNPGAEYADTRHNVGFRVVDALARRLRTGLTAGVGPWRSGRGRWNGREIDLLVPLTFMNRSGVAVARYLESAGLAPDDLMIVLDDMDLPLGKIRMRMRGSSGGQKGLRSVIEHVGTEAVPRLRLGIGPCVGDGADFVLSPFEEDERKTAEEMIERACEAVLAAVDDGIPRAMSRYNG